MNTINADRKYEKITILLLLLLIVASCLSFTSCDKGESCVDGVQHDFSGSNGLCTYCHKKYCEVYDSHDYTDGYCRHCGKTKGGNFWGGLGIIVVSTLIASVVYWLAVVTDSNVLVHIENGLMIVVTIYMFVTHGIGWGLAMLILGGGSYLGFICPAIYNHCS